MKIVWPIVFFRMKMNARWLTPIIPATQEAEIRRTVVQTSPHKKFTRHHLDQ
jgi:hypothetical protein